MSSAILQQPFVFSQYPLQSLVDEILKIVSLHDLLNGAQIPTVGDLMDGLVDSYSFYQMEIPEYILSMRKKIAYETRYSPPNPHYLVADSYNWAVIRESLVQIVSACDQDPKWPIDELLVQTWKCLPYYLNQWAHRDTCEINTSGIGELNILHAILTKPQRKAIGINSTSIDELPAGYALCIDTSFVSKVDRLTMNGYLCGKLFSVSRKYLEATIQPLGLNFRDITVIRNKHASEINESEIDESEINPNTPQFWRDFNKYNRVNDEWLSVGTKKSIDNIKRREHEHEMFKSWSDYESRSSKRVCQ